VTLPAVLLVHNRYQQAGGEDVVFEAEARLLADRGHRVARFVVDNAAIPVDRSPIQAIRLAVETTWSFRAAARMRRMIQRFRPDVVHAHNTFPLISPSIHAAAHGPGIGTVQTLHNYRLICPAATLFRDGHVCHDCIGQAIPWPSVRHECYRDSATQSLAVATMLTVHRARGTWTRNVDVIVALTEFARQQLAAGGLPAERLTVKPNFLAPDPGPGAVRGEHFLFIGRLDALKGVRTLLEAWRSLDVPLRVVGDGPLRPEVESAAAANPHLSYLGHLDRRDVIAEVQGARALLFPSIWYEGLPMTIIEAFACATPVIASNLGAMSEMITDGSTGLLADPGDTDRLAALVRWSSEHPGALARIGAAGRAEYLRLYTADRHYDSVTAIYERARARANGDGNSGNVIGAGGAWSD
jgi:glycosyltransferase involved in cell wall biosynthesis